MSEKELVVQAPKLQAPSVQDAVDIGLNVFALKLVAESMPAVLSNLEKMGVPLGTGVELVLSSKDGKRWKLIVSATEELATRGDGAL